MLAKRSIRVPELALLSWDMYSYPRLSGVVNSSGFSVSQLILKVVCVLHV